MDQKRVLYKVEEGIGVVTLNREEKGNAIDDPMAAEFAGILKDLRLSEEVKVLIVTGKGPRAFSTGTDPEGVEGRASMERLSMADWVASLEIPTLAAVNGDAFGQGLELALACDLRICTKGARFALSQVPHGELPWDGGTQRLPRLVGKGKALEMILLGEAIDALEAHRIGLVHRVVPPEDLLAESMKTAREIASRSPIAIRYAKEAVLEGMDMTLEQGLRLEGDLYFLLHTTHDRTEGIRAFREKRTPRFEGR